MELKIRLLGGWVLELRFKVLGFGSKKSKVRVRGLRESKVRVRAARKVPD